MRERPHGVHRAQRRAVRLGAPRGDGDDVGAELGEFGDHETVQPLADGSEQDHRGDAHRDAERGEHRAQAMRPERGIGKSDEVGEEHDRSAYRRDSACTGSSIAARRAGASVNSTAVITAVAGAATSAHHGAWNGIAGYSCTAA